MANLYAQKLKNLSDQINIMLMEAGLDGEPELTEMPGASDAKADADAEAAKMLVRMKNYLGGKSYDKQSKDYFSKVSGFTERIKKVSDIQQKPGMQPSADELANYEAGEQSGLKAIILSGTAIVVGTLGFLNIFAKGLDEVKKMTDLALNSSNYQEFSKAVKALQKIATNNSLWSKLTVSSSAKQLAMTNTDIIKKGYIMAGVAMIIVSVILVTLTGSMIDIVGSIKEAIKSLDVKAILVAIGKMLGLGVLVMPAILGVCLIVIAIHGFNDGDTAAKVASACYPVMKVINVIIAKIIEVSQNAARNKVQSIKKMKALKK